MAIKVAKFGGSSLADAEQFKKVKAIMFADDERLFVVPSAPGKRDSNDEKITDLLFQCHRLAAAGRSFDEVFSHIEDRYIGIERDLNLSTNIKSELEKIKRQIKKQKVSDYAASRGEYLNGILLANFLGYDFIDAKELIVFDENGQFNSEATQQKIEQIADRRNVVIPGFYGARPDGSIQVFPRGGSDITGAIVARGVSADIYENWTDVSGFLMADPRIISNPKVIRTVTYSELRELAYMGATVLHEDSIFPVREASIPINVRNTNAPDEAGTMIVPDENADLAAGQYLTGVAGKKGFTVVAIGKDNMHDEVGFGYRALEVLNKHGISFEHIPSGIDTMSIVVATSQIENIRQRIIDDLMRACSADTIELYDHMALIATVGRGMVQSVGVAARLFTALAKSGINIRMIDQGSSELNIIVGVEEQEFEKALRAIYEEFAE